jgi:hypothetical protein
VPEVEALLPRFRAAHTQVLGVSVDSIYCHANWARSLGGISFPLLADFHPKGTVADAYGLYLDNAGITDRATVLIDAGGTVRHASSVGPGGRRNIAELAGLCEEMDRAHGDGLADIALPAGLARNEVLYVKSSCGFSRKVLLARDNLRLGDVLPVRNVSDDPAAREELVRVAGKDQAPCLVLDGEVVSESDAIVRHLVAHTCDLA